MKKKLISVSVIITVIASMFAAVTPVATSAAKPGIVYTQGTKFVLDGYPFYYAGCNSYDLFTKSHAEIDKRFSNMAEAGVRVVRTWAFSHETWHGFEPQKGVYSEEQFRLFDYIVKSAGEHGIKLIVTLENYWEAYGGIDARLKWEGLPGVSHANRAKFFTDPGCKEGYLNYVKHIVTRTNYYTGVPYKDDPIIFAWELMNEPRYQDAGENSTGTTLRKWVDEMGAYIKSLDSNHMLSCGLEGHESKYGFGGDEGNPFVYIQQSPYIDFCTAHPYPDEAWANLTSQQAAILVDKWIDDAHNVVGKPFVLEEFNTHSKKAEYWNAMYAEMERLDAAGDNFWNYNDISTSDFDMLYGDPLLDTVFKPHADKMAAKNSSPVHKPLDFKLLSPESGASGILPGVEFRWETAIGAGTYNLTVSENSSLSNPVISVTGLKATQYVPSEDLKLGTKYYWKVTAVNSLGSTDASNSGVSFTTRAAPTVKPGSFNPKSPENNTVGTGLRPVFTWSKSAEALSYSLVVSKSSSLSSPVVNVSRLSDTSYTPATDLELGVTYYWGVIAVNNVGSTTASGNGSSFTTVDIPPVDTTVKVSAMLNGSTKQETQYKVVVSNTGGSSVNKFSARIYLDLSEVYAAGYSSSNIVIEKLYDQTSGKTTLTGPFAWDEDKRIYYVQINWNDYALNEGASIEQDVRVRLDNWASVIDASNDFSFTGLGSSYKDTEYIPVYRGNLKMWGNDPQRGSVSPTPTGGTKLYGYISPDFVFSPGAAPLVNADFTVEIDGVTAKTDSTGYFEITLADTGEILTPTINITKPGYLKRIINGIAISGETRLSTPDAPILLWAGDVPINGVQDGAINISDIMEAARIFNSTYEDGKYVAYLDVDRDNAINLTDIMIIARHFNSSVSSYN